MDHAGARLTYSEDHAKQCPCRPAAVAGWWDLFLGVAIRNASKEEQIGIMTTAEALHSVR